MQVCELKGWFLSNSTPTAAITRTLDHPFFLGLQAHPEFCTRPLNPSPPFLGFVAASCGANVLAEQLSLQEKGYIPPHPEASMVSEEELKLLSRPLLLREGEKGMGRSGPRPGDVEEARRHADVVQAVNEA